MNNPKKRVLLGVTGCIAAYKSCEILRALQKGGVDVQVVMTETAKKFVGPATFEALSGFPVGCHLFEDDCGAIPHITLAESCDLFLVAPCTANVLAKLTYGIADDLLTSSALAVTAPIVIAPAMNVHMYENPATQHNIQVLRDRGVHVIDVASGYLACGDIGPGKLPEPDAIAQYALKILDSGDSSEAVNLTQPSESDASKPLSGKRVLITSGPTVEPIDSARYISNYSSGKMGAALAEAANAAGADVEIVSGPVYVSYPTGSNVIYVRTAQEMHDEAVRLFENADAAICAAAVADYKPKITFDRKLKKGIDDEVLDHISLVKNPDILKELGARKRTDQMVIGFAAETDNLISNAINKLKSKNADMIVANEVGENKGFNKDTNKAALVTSTSVEELPELPKRELANRIIHKLSEEMRQK